MQMTNSGVLVLKKHKNFNVKFLFCLISIITIFFSGCQSIPEENIVDSIYILSAENSVFYSVPSNFDDELVKNIFSMYKADFQQKDLDLFKKYIKKIYAGTSFTDHENLQAIISGDFPVAYINSLLKKNLCYKKSILDDAILNKKYTIYEYEDYQICVISKHFIFISNNIYQMIKNYETLFYKIDTTDYKSNFDSTYYEFFNSDESTLKMYVKSVSAFNDLLKGLGLNVSLNLKNIILTQNLYVIDNDEKNYSSDIQIILENAKIAKLLKTMIAVMLTMSDNKSELYINDNIVGINNFLIPKDSIVSNFIEK